MKNTNYKKIIISLVMILSIVLPVFITNTVEAHAASKKTVRVATEKQLKSALKNSKVGTIILRTQTYNDITINSKKAKKKNIIIDAPNAVVTNKSKFKSIELQNAAKYIEAVSGNTITTTAAYVLEVAEGCSVKKLIMPYLLPGYIIRKGASIKSIVLKNLKHVSTFDKKTRTLSFETTGTWTSYDYTYYGDDGDDVISEEYPEIYTAILDKSGRTLSYNYMGWQSDYTYEYKYDKNGNCTECRVTNEENGLLERTTYYDYDDGNNKVSENNEHSYHPYDYGVKYIYDKQGRLSEVISSSEEYSEETEYNYDEKGRVIGECTNKFWFENDGRLSSRRSWITKNEYDKNGNLVKSIISYDEGFSYNYFYEYDKEGNLVHYTNILDDKGMQSTYEYKYVFDEYGNQKEVFYKYEDEWYNMADYAG